MKRLLVGLAMTALVPLIGCSKPAAKQDPVVLDQADLPEVATKQIQALLAEKEGRSPSERKIGSQLLYARSGKFTSTLQASKDPAKQITSLVKSDAKGRFLVDISGDPATVVGQVAAVGGEVVATSTPHQGLRAWVPQDRLDELAANATVRAIRPALLATTSRVDQPGADPKFHASREERVAAVQRAQAAWAARNVPPAAGGAVTNAGSVTSEGVAAHGADKARKLYNADGRGVTVGVLSDSDDLREESIASGDLPADTIAIPGQDGRPGSGEGTAMMEIVHEVAPAAKIVFATAFNSPESFADNIRALRFTYHADIIVDDVIYFFESPYEDDIIAQAVADVTADGALYFSSAGNGGNANDGTSGTWEGDFKPAGTLSSLPTGYTVHNFGNKVISNRIESGGGPLFLHWSDPGTLDNPASSNDYDLFLLSPDMQEVVLASTDLQDGAGLPLEFLGFNIPAGYRVVVAKKANAEVRAIRLVLSNGEFGISTGGGTWGHNSTAGGFGVAAVDSAVAAGGEFIAGPTTQVEVFSSDGPRRIFYDRNNNPIDEDAVTFAEGGGELRNKPDIAGADGVSTTLPSFTGLNPFFGTSAAAPHVAAIAALVKSAKPTASPNQIRRALLEGAVDIEAAGADRDSGRGVASALGALNKAGAPLAVFLETNAVTITPVGTTLLGPGASGTIRVQLINNGGANATAVSATLTTTSPDVTITRATSSYPTVFAGSTATNPTAFAFTISPTAPCGIKIPFTLTVNYTGNGPKPVALTFGAQTGQPSSTFETTTYAGAPAAIPDGDTVGVDVPLAVATAGAVSKVVFHLDGSACSTAIGSTTVGVDHSWVGDLTFTLTAPDGTAVTLINAAGGRNNSGNNFCQTVLSDGAASSIQTVTSAQAPFTGTFSPANPQSGFAGATAAGTWNLHVVDGAFIDSGSVRAFGIDVYGFTCTP